MGPEQNPPNVGGGGVTAGGRDPNGWRWWIIVAAIVFVAATVGVVAGLVLGDIGLGITIGVAVLSIMRDIQRR